MIYWIFLLFYVIYIFIKFKNSTVNRTLNHIINLINREFNKNLVGLSREIIDTNPENNLYNFINFQNYINRETNLESIKIRNPCKYIKLMKMLILSKYSKYNTLKNKLNKYISLYGNNIHINNINNEFIHINKMYNKYLNREKTDDILKIKSKINIKIWFLNKIKKYLFKIKNYENNFFKLPVNYTGGHIALIGSKNETYIFNKLYSVIKLIENMIDTNKYELIFLKNINIFKNDYFIITNYFEIINNIVNKYNFKKDKNAKGEIDAILMVKDKLTGIAYVISIYEFKSSLEGLYKDFNKFYLLIDLLKQCNIVVKLNNYAIKSFNFDKIYKDNDSEFYYHNIYYIIDSKNINTYSCNINKFKLIDFLSISKQEFFDEYILNREHIIQKKYDLLIKNRDYLDNKFIMMCDFIGFNKKIKTIQLI